MERGGQTYFYHADAVGSIAVVTDASGNPACTYSYDSFGRTQPCQSVANPFTFAGREYDAESGLYYMRARYYDPATGRFTTADPLDLTGRLMTGTTGVMGAPQQLNRYSYAVNNPLVFRDPSGLACNQPPLEFLALLGTFGAVGRASVSTILDGPTTANLPESFGQISGAEQFRLSDMAVQLTWGALTVAGALTGVGEAGTVVNMSVSNTIVKTLRPTADQVLAAVATGVKNALTFFGATTTTGGAVGGVTGIVTGAATFAVTPPTQSRTWSEQTGTLLNVTPGPAPDAGAPWTP
jgi:RHS repeat-associated protein